jgi:hypothetical protein
MTKTPRVSRVNCPQFNKATRKRTVNVQHCAATPFETHAITENISSHNREGILPAAKLKEKGSKDDCMLRSLHAALHGLPLGSARQAANRYVRNKLQQELSVVSAPGTEEHNEDHNHGSHKKGYKVGDVVAAAKLLNARIFAPRNLYLAITARKRLQYRSLMKLSSGQRKGRCFVVFGGALANEPRARLLAKIDKCNQTCHMQKVLGTGGIMGKHFFQQSEYALHAICVKYDAAGHGVIDDPGKKIFHAVTMHNLCNCLGYISDVLECSLVHKTYAP